MTYELKEHPIYQGYFASKDGRVFSNKGADGKIRELKSILQKSNNGYYLISCYVNGKKHQIYTHRFIAEIFLPNPNNFCEINHIDEDKSNNCVKNLEWCDRKYNASYSLSKIYLVENLKTGEKVTIFNLKKWCKDNNINYHSATDNIRGKTKTLKKTFKICKLKSE